MSWVRRYRDMMQNEEVLQELQSVYDFLRCANEQKRKSDAIFVFGHIDARIAAHAASLWHQGIAPRIIVTGKGRKSITGFDTEADFFASVIAENGVPESAVLRERKSLNTLENVIFGMDACHASGFFPTSLTLCAFPGLLRRSRATFAKQFPTIITSCSGPVIPLEEFVRDRIVRLLAEFNRFDEYEKKGDIARVAVPVEIKKNVTHIRALLT